MKVAIPIVNGKLSDHFGHSEKFKFYYIEDGKVDKTEEVPSPPHQPGFLPEWLHEQGANIIITGGMGQKAKLLFDENGIEVFTGVRTYDTDEIIKLYLEGKLNSDNSFCQH